MESKEYIKAAVLFLLLSAGVIAAARFEQFYRLTWLEKLDRPLLFIALQAAQVILAPLPGGVTALASGYLFGTWNGVLYTMIGVTIGSITVFYLSRWLGRSFVQHLAERHSLQRYDDVLREHGPAVLFLAFLLPFFPDDLLCCIAGMTGMRVRDLLWTVVLGRFPLFVAYSYLGANAQRYTDPGFIATVTVFMLVSVAIFIYRDHLQRFIIGSETAE